MKICLEDFQNATLRLIAGLKRMLTVRFVLARNRRVVFSNHAHIVDRRAGASDPAVR
jgi:hypothetical protein